MPSRSANIHVQLRTAEVKGQVHRLAAAVINKQVALARERAAAAAPYDSGFLRNNVYGIPVGGSGRAAVMEMVVNRRGRRSLRRAASVPSPGPMAGAVGSAADYSRHIERTRPFLAAAVLSAARDALASVPTL
jgi:hypothetical protein